MPAIDAGLATLASQSTPSAGSAPSRPLQRLLPHAAIEIRGLSLTFQAADTPVVALDDINLTIRRGEFVSFIGPSGCGKTTLLRVIADLEAPSAGAITVNGVSPEAARLNRAYGYVFQAPALYAWRSVLRNVMLPLEIIGMPASERKTRARAICPWWVCRGSSANFLGNCRAACSSACRLRARSPSSRSCC